MGSSEKKEKKEKKRSEMDGVRKEKKDKKEKKEKKERLAQALDEHLQASAAADAAASVKAPARGAGGAGHDDDAADVEVDQTRPRGALVYFAKPLADEKGHKKVYKCIKKATKKHAVLRGAKEVNKALRKSPLKTPSTTAVPGVIIIAGDISPAEVIMHLPLLCEEHNVPYIFVQSRAELGAAARTKRPTSVVMLVEQGRKAKKAAEKKKDEAEDEDEDDYADAYKELIKLAKKEGEKQLKGII